MNKIKWGNVGYLFMFALGGNVILHDLYRLTLETILTGKLMQLTYLGIITLIISIAIFTNGYQGLKKEFNTK